MAGLIEVIKGDRELAVEPQTLDKYLSDGWERKPVLMSEESPTVSGEEIAARQRLVKIFRDDEVRFRELDLVRVLEAQGWSRTPPERRTPKKREPEAARAPEKTKRERLIEILTGLDKNDDSLWTSAGAPRLSEVSRLMGERVDVDEIREAIPDFRRGQ